MKVYVSAQTLPRNRPPFPLVLAKHRWKSLTYMNQVKLTRVINLIKSILIYLILNYLNPSVYLFLDYALPNPKNISRDGIKCL
jgi:hypothetical protein